MSSSHRARTSYLNRRSSESQTEPNELSLSLFLLSRFPTMLGLSLTLSWVFFKYSFHCGAFASWVFCYAWPALMGLSQGYFTQVKSESCTLCVGEVCNFLGSDLTTAKISSDGWTSVTALCYSSFYLARKKENTSLKSWGRLTQRCKKRSLQLNSKPLFICFSPSPWACSI